MTRPVNSRPVVAAIGIFDGVHAGHQAILKKAAARARALGGSPVAVTFYPHPLSVLKPTRAPELLMPLSERVRAIAGSGVPEIRVIPFTRSFSRWSPEQFVRRILAGRLRVREVVVGHDFGFGAGRAGTPDTLRRLGLVYGFRTWVMPPVRRSGERISSRRIRERISRGELAPAARLMGRPVSVWGTVVRGSGRGAKLGFPTANLKREAGILPLPGVYAVRARLGGRSYPGMANLGHRPTFGGKKTVLEVHLFGVRRRLYGRRLEVVFVRRLRGERRFPSPEALAGQLARDAARARRVFALQARRRVV